MMLPHGGNDEMTINDIMKKYDMNRSEFSRRLKIGYRTVQKWALPKDNIEHRKCPDYVMRMILVILENDLDLPEIPEFFE